MGELNTQDELYNIDFEKDDFSNIIKWTKLAAEQGATWALDQLGAMFFYGIGVEQDYEKSFECYQQVAAKGFPGSEWGLGDFYLKGIVVQQNTEKAVSIYFNCAKAGNPIAAYRLVTLYKDKDPHFAFACCFICNSLLGNTEAEKDLLDEVFQIVWDLSEKMNGREVIAAQLQADSFLRENDL
ncbi:MAG: sel1 repeat family protein [Simkania sp.]|nr:sel1 repeat family protein [Simkania sp.]